MNLVLKVACARFYYDAHNFFMSFLDKGLQLFLGEILVSSLVNASYSQCGIIRIRNGRMKGADTVGRRANALIGSDTLLAERPLARSRTISCGGLPMSRGVGWDTLYVCHFRCLQNCAEMLNGQ